MLQTRVFALATIAIFALSCANEGQTGPSGTGGSSPGTGGSVSPSGDGGSPPTATGGVKGTGGAVATGGSVGTGGHATGGITGALGGHPGGGNPGSGGAVSGTGGTPGAAGSSGGACTSESCTSGCTVPALPSYSSITQTNAKLPDPFLMLSGTRMTSNSQWECRRAELASEFQTYELGQKNPKPPGAVTGSYAGGTLTVNVGGKSFTVTVTLPKTGKPPYPAIIALDGGSLPTTQITGLGVAMISLSTNTLGDQTAASSRGKGFFFDVNGADSGAGSLIAWAWGASRIIDALEVTPSAMIDPTHIGMTGCSRNGKGALVAGALDERIKLTIPQESGSGGTASWRISDAEDGGKNIVQTLGEIVGEDDWFSTTLTQFANAHAATKLPEDHHELLGLVAPRGLFIIENTDYQWLGVNSCVTDATAAQMIFQGLGAKDNIAFEQHGHTHCSFDSTDEWPALQAFIQKFLLEQSVSTQYWHVTSTQFGSTSSTIDTAKWIDWTIPTLN